MSELRVVLVTVATAFSGQPAGGVFEEIVSRDLVLNCDVPTSRLVDLLRHEMGRAPVSPESPAEEARWSLHAVDGANRTGRQSLREFGVVDGEVLVLWHNQDPAPAETAEAAR